MAVGRLGIPDEIAKVVLFLCSDLASYVQGVMIPVDRGFLSSWILDASINRENLHFAAFIINP